MPTLRYADFVLLLKMGDMLQSILLYGIIIDKPLFIDTFQVYGLLFGDRYINQVFTVPMVSEVRKI